MRTRFPPLLKDAVNAHEVLVGMNHRMVLAAMGEPERKIREQASGDASGATLRGVDLWPPAANGPFCPICRRPGNDGRDRGAR